MIGRRIRSERGRDERQDFGRGELLLTFGEYDLRPRSRVLAKGQELIPLGARAFDVLVALVEHAGTVVTYQELLARAWPKTLVDDTNLRVQISGLRRLLVSEDPEQPFIVNVARRGYVFRAPVTTSWSGHAPPVAPRRPIGNLPILMGGVFGRAEPIAAIRKKLRSTRLVTVTGPGGIGKTTVALAAAQDLPVDFAWFIDLAAIAEHTLLPTTLARALGIAARPSQALTKVLAFLDGKESLIILDNCERLIGASAELALSLLSTTPSLRMLVTSRQPLHVREEWVYRLGGLPTLDPPPKDAALARKCPSIQLFVARVRAHTDTFEINDSNAPFLGTVCRRLEGIPLAIELAAGAAGSIGLRELAQGLESHLDHLELGRRTTHPHQRTLKATLDWSYDLLGEDEKTTLARLSVFHGAFTLESVVALCADEVGGATRAVRALAELVDKSLIVASSKGDPFLYRLLETTREYAQARLAESADDAAIQSRFARHVGAVFQAAQKEWNAQSAGQWAERHRRWIGDIRQAMAWSKSAGGDINVGAALLIASSQLWFDLGFLSEFLDHVGEVRDAGKIDPRLHMRLSTVAGNAVFMLETSPVVAAQMYEALSSALDRAVALGDQEQQFYILLSQVRACAWTGDYKAMATLAERLLVVGLSLGRPDAHRYHALMMGAAQQRLGNLALAEPYIEAAARDLDADAGENEFALNSQLFNKSIDARERWMRGRPDQALRLLKEVIDGALADGHVPSYGHVLPTVLLVGVGIGEPAFVAGPLETFLKYGGARSLDYHHVWRAYATWGHRARAERWTFDQAREVLAASDFELGNFTREMLTTLHPGFRVAGMLENVEAGRCGWCAPEIIRSHGIELESRGRHAEAEGMFRDALRRAQAQGALSWELRAAMSLSVAMARRGDGEAGRDLLAGVLSRFTEGFESADYMQAASQLDALEAGANAPNSV
jgi:predicted ATPase/DNA-binding winged helix-turn-helix (wHTH) protein